MKNLFKHFFLILIFTFSFSFSSSTHAGIPVVDGTNLANNINSEVQNIVQFVNQVNQLIQTYNQDIATFNSIHGIRNFQQLLNNPTARQYMPTNWSTMYVNMMASSGCNSSMESGALAQCNQLAKANADQAINAQIQQQITQRKQDIQSLIDQLGNAPDAKDSQDLNVRINGEVAALSAEQAELTAYKNFSDLQNAQNDKSIMDNLTKPISSDFVNPFLNAN